MIGAMRTVHITEAELARDLHAILAKVQQGVEVVVEQDHQPVVVLRHLVSGEPQPRDMASWDRLLLHKFLEESGPGWNLEEHPELNLRARELEPGRRHLHDRVGGLVTAERALPVALVAPRVAFVHQASGSLAIGKARIGHRDARIEDERARDEDARSQRSNPESLRTHDRPFLRSRRVATASASEECC